MQGQKQLKNRVCLFFRFRIVYKVVLEVRLAKIDHFQASGLSLSWRYAFFLSSLLQVINLEKVAFVQHFIEQFDT